MKLTLRRDDQIWEHVSSARGGSGGTAYDDTQVKEGIETNKTAITAINQAISAFHNYDDAAIKESISDKEGKVEGKALSTNDFTDEIKKQIETNTMAIGDMHTALNSILGREV